MAVLPSLRPTDVISNVNIVVTGGAANGAVALNDSDHTSISLTDGTTVYDSGTTSGDLRLNITDMPADFGTIQTPLTVSAVTQASAFIDDSDTLTVQIFAADGTTAYTDQVTLSTQAHILKGVRTASLTVNATGLAANRTAWNGARLRMIWTYGQNMSKDNGIISVWSIGIDGNYNVLTATTRTKTHSIDARIAVKSVRTKTYSVDASFLTKRTKTHNIDSIIVPPAPTNVNYVVGSIGAASGINVGWNDTTIGATYELERDSIVIATDIAEQSYFDGGLTPSTTYIYRVRSLFNGVYSAWSEPASLSTSSPPQIFDLAATAQSASSVLLTYTSSINSWSFEVERDGVPIDSTSADSESFLDTGLTPNTL